jgi:protein deglycase
MARTLIPLADGVEEAEAVIITDVLRRAGWQVETAGLTAREVTAAHGVRLTADALWAETAPAAYDVLLIPGGRRGVDALCGDARVLDAVRLFVSDGKLVGALCAGPLVLQRAGVLDALSVTCHPGVRAELDPGVRFTGERVTFDGGLLTSQGPGTAFEFALAAVRHQDGDAAADAAAEGLVLP